MRRIADDVEEAAWALLLLLLVGVEPKEGAVAVVIDTVMYLLPVSKNGRGGRKEKRKTKGACVCRVWSVIE
jgi:hypothetical protein